MSLQRQEILERIQDLILFAHTAAGTTVYINKAEPDQGADLPIVTIYGWQELIGQFVERTPRRYIRVLTVAIDMKVADADSQAGSVAMNNLAEQVERAVLHDPLLPNAGGEPLANDVRFAGMNLAFSSGSSQIVVGMQLRLEVDYVYEQELLAPITTRSLKEVHAQVNLAGGEAVDMEADVALQGG